MHERSAGELNRLKRSESHHMDVKQENRCRPDRRSENATHDDRVLPALVTIPIATNASPRVGSGVRVLIPNEWQT